VLFRSTLIESSNHSHFEEGQNLLKKILPHTGNSIRIGITGVPGAGKSTLIDKIGLLLIAEGHKVAVLAIDPSSSKSGGSILGDKTRMEYLAKSKKAFIRPSAAGGKLGGVARKTRESILLCEAAGFDIILVETVGVGQAEIDLKQMVDFFLLVQIAGAGDELQGIKKGIMEMVDAIVINKADADNKSAAMQTQRELKLAIHYIAKPSTGWKIPVLTCSAISGDGVKEIWQNVKTYVEKSKEQDYFQSNRKAQELNWFHSLVKDSVQELILRNPIISESISNLEKEISETKITTSSAILSFEKLLKQKITF